MILIVALFGGLLIFGIFLAGVATFVYLGTKEASATTSPITGTPPATTTPTPPTPKFWTLGKAVRLGLVAGALLFVWFALEDTVLGKALYKAGRSTAGDEWLPYLVLYLPTAILAWVAYRIAFGKSVGVGGIGISPTAIIVTLILAAGALGVAHMLRPIESAPAMVKVEFRPGDVGKKSDAVTIGPNTEIWVNFPVPSSIADQNANGVYRACAEVVGVPSVALKAPIRLEGTASGNYLRKFKLTEDSRTAIQGLRAQTVDVMFRFGRTQGVYKITCS